MNESELNALISLLDDEDGKIFTQIEQKIISLGEGVIPLLETEWESNINPLVQKRIEDLVHTLQYDSLKARIAGWFEEENPDLLRGMWLVATYQYPDLEYDKLKKDLEQLYYEAWLEFKPEAHPFDKIKILNSVLFSKLKYRANTKNFHSPGNSMINVVMETKKGNPITLCVLYLLVAQKLKLPVYGVNLPNLFILTYKEESTEQFYINAFSRGLIFSKEDIDNYIEELRLTPQDTYYQPCDQKDIVRRALRNLVNSFEKIGDHEKSEEVKELLKGSGN